LGSGDRRIDQSPRLARQKWGTLSGNRKKKKKIPKTKSKRLKR
jgi:hypothetical protein